MHKSCKTKLWTIISNPDYLQRHWSSLISFTWPRPKKLTNLYASVGHILHTRIERMILNGIANGYFLWIEITNTTNGYYMSICLCVQIKGGPHIGHLLESNLSRHTFSLQCNEPFQQCSIHWNCLNITVNMDTDSRHVYDAYLRNWG